MPSTTEDASTHRAGEDVWDLTGIRPTRRADIRDCVGYLVDRLASSNRRRALRGPIPAEGNDEP